MAIGLLIDVMRTAYAIRFYIAAEKKSSESLIPNTLRCRGYTGD